jgi:hypothetical protein
VLCSPVSELELLDVRSVTCCACRMKQEETGRKEKRRKGKKEKDEKKKRKKYEIFSKLENFQNNKR